jgi:hypothetical protein
MRAPGETAMGSLAGNVNSSASSSALSCFCLCASSESCASILVGMDEWHLEFLIGVLYSTIYRFFRPYTQAIACIQRTVRCNLCFHAVADRQRPFSADDLIASLLVMPLENPGLHDGICGAGLLAEATVNALE